MYDALTIAAIVDELGQELANGRIQRIQHVDRLTVGIEIYARRQRRWLILSADSQAARILLRESRGNGDPELISPLLLLLKKYARGGRLLAVRQPRHERLVQLSFATAEYPDVDDEDDDDDQDVEIDLIYNELIVELMGRHSNIILIAESGQIRDSAKRVTHEMSRVRTVLPAQPYAPPPPQDKLDPLLVQATSLHSRASESDQRVDRWLVATILSLSPMLAREAIYRAGIPGDHLASQLSELDTANLVQALHDMFEPVESSQWAPAFYTFDDGGAEFSAIRMQHLAARDDVSEQPCASVLHAAEQAWEIGRPEAPAAGDRHATRRQRLIDDIERGRKRILQRKRSLQEQQERAADPDQLRIRGEMIYAYLWKIEPGQISVETDDGLEIDLDPDLSATDNAQAYFERYRKAKAAVESIPAMLTRTKWQLEYIDQLQTMANQAESYDEIESARLEWRDYATDTPGLSPGKPSKGSKPSRDSRRPRTYRTAAGDTLLIGRTGVQNDTVTFNIAGPDDLWLHARDMPGAHVILRHSTNPESDTAIEQAASLAAYYSQGRGATRVPIDVTLRKHVRKIKGAGLGMVTYQNEYTINVEPKSANDLELEAIR